MNFITILVNLLSELVAIGGTSYNDMVTCTSIQLPVLQTGLDGACVQYSYLDNEASNPCDPFYVNGVDHFYLPDNRATGIVYFLNSLIAQSKLTIDVISQPCREFATRVLCYYFYPPCQIINSTHFIPPASVCKDACNTFVDNVCSTEYQLLLMFVRTSGQTIELYNLHFPNCSDPSLPIRPFGQNCCSNAGVFILDVVISLESSEYITYEDDEFVEICMTLVEGSIQREIPVTLTTVMISAEDGTDYSGVERTLTMSPGVTRVCLNITIIYDDEFEDQNEQFRIDLSSSDPLVTFNVTSAIVSIVNSDVSAESSPVVTIASSVSAGVVLLILAVSLVVGIILGMKAHRLRTPLKIVIEEPSRSTAGGLGKLNIANPTIEINGDTVSTPTVRYTNTWNNAYEKSETGKYQRMAKVSSGFLRQMSEDKLLIPSSSIKLLDCIGQGEFGIVYRAHLSSYEGRSEPGLVAVKTLKVIYSMKDLNSLAEECTKMAAFDHQNVLSLIGVCIDAGEAPYLIMPFMELGSLLSYLRRERAQLTLKEGVEIDLINETQKKLLSMCLQIVSGMRYLAHNKFVHRDLAARNCMIDSNFVIKVADFGLSEDIYVRNYFRQPEMSQDESGEKSEGVKLPIRWMALESLHDGIFTEKTDVWSFGVTCWEVFSLGRTPYPAVDPFTLIKYLEQGKRLDKPSNAACTDNVFELVQTCWDQNPNDRPSFDNLKTSIASLLEGISGYMDFSAILTEKNNGKSYDHLSRYDQLIKDDDN